MLCSRESKTLQGPWPKSPRGVCECGAKSAALTAQTLVILLILLLPKLFTESLLSYLWLFYSHESRLTRIRQRKHIDSKLRVLERSESSEEGIQPRCCAGKGSQTGMMGQQKWKQATAWAPRAFSSLRDVTEGCYGLPLFAVPSSC